LRTTFLGVGEIKNTITPKLAGIIKHVTTHIVAYQMFYIEETVNPWPWGTKGFSLKPGALPYCMYCRVSQFLPIYAQ
jgi:hypothetical protein